MVGWINVVIDGMTNQRSCAFVLCPLVLEPGFHLSFSELESKGEDLPVGWKEVVLFLKSSFQHLNLFRGEAHSASLWTVGPIRRFSLQSVSRIVVVEFLLISVKSCFIVAC